MEKSRWTALGEILARPDLRVVRGSERQRLLAEHREIADLERGLDDRLFLGIIGGTGVGKSTLINAIAGAVVSRSGDRRPTTDRVVAYRHRRFPLPDDLPRGDLAQPEALHDEAPLERLVIFDFPDFDSVEADHAALLGRFLPRLDVLLVLVDDAKYGDQRLFDILRALPQAPRNLHFLLNKVDRLEERYRGGWKNVAQEILADFSRKLKTHAGLSPPERPAAISARVALERRASRGAASAQVDGAPEGEFQAVLDLLQGYHLEKRRRAAKEANIDARKGTLAARVRASGLDPARRARAAAAREAIAERERELSGILAAIPEDALGPREARRLRAGALDRAAPRLALPVAWAVRLVGGRRSAILPTPAELAALARAHYLPCLEALGTAEREIRESVAEVAGPAGGDRPAPGKLLEQAGEMRRDLEARLGRTLRLSRLRDHLFPLLAVLGWLWFAFHALIADVTRRLAAGEPVSWRDLAARALAALIAALSPTGILLGIGAVILAYVLTVFLDLTRIRRATSAAAAAFSRGVRDDVRRDCSARLGTLSAALDAWERERKELERVIPERPAESNTGKA